jgi:hypothetical protein
MVVAPLLRKASRLHQTLRSAVLRRQRVAVSIVFAAVVQLRAAISLELGRDTG